LYKLPSKVNDIKFRRSTLPMTSKFKPETPWWVLVQMSLNLSIAMAQSLFQEAEWQIAWMTSCFMLYQCLLISYRPYFCPVTYYCDVASTFGKALILTAAVPYQMSPDGKGTYVTAVAVVVYMVVIGHCAYAMTLWIRFMVRDEITDISKVWEDLGGRLVAKLKFPRGASMEALMHEADAAASLRAASSKDGACVTLPVGPPPRLGGGGSGDGVKGQTNGRPPASDFEWNWNFTGIGAGSGKPRVPED